MTQLGTPASQRAPARIRRSRTDKVVAGVCGGLGRYFGVDPIWFRIAFVILAVGGGSGVLLYVVGWILIPVEDGAEGAERGAGAQGPMIAGMALVGVGLVFLTNNLAPWLSRFFWPAAVIAVGVGLVYAGRRRERT
jgi:phage shock protein C